MLIALLAALQVAQDVRSPGPVQRYRLDVTTNSELDQSTIGKPKMIGGLVTHAIITVSMRDTTGGQIAQVVVDSMTLEPSGLIVPQLAEHPNAAANARGAWVRAYIVHGKQQGGAQISDSTNNPALAAVVQALGVLFPGIRRGAKVGDSWADTSHVNNSSGPRHQTGEIVAAWKVIAAEGDGLVLRGTSDARTRTEDGSGQMITMTGGSKEEVVVPATGPVRRATIESSNSILVSSPQMAQPIPGTNGGSLKLTPLP